jgi:hypothetical protein
MPVEVRHTALDDPLVSIVIPVHNGARYLADAIDSALQQTYPRLEIIVVNDGSTDDGLTAAVAGSFGTRIRYIEQPHGYVASALNAGIRAMRGQYFSWLSHDDLYRPAKTAVQLKAIRTLGPNAIVYGDYDVLDEDTRRLAQIRAPEVPPEQFRYAITRASFLHGCSLLIPKACLDAAGPFDETLRTTQDYDLWFRLAAFCRFVHVPGIVVRARRHAEQMSQTLSEHMAADSDALLTRFVHELTGAELAASGQTVAAAYEDLAEAMGQRKFSRAQKAAQLLADRARGEEPLFTRLASTVRPPRVSAALRPVVRRARAVARRLPRRWHPDDARQRFTAFYRDNTFGGDESYSGVGSGVERTAAVRQALPAILQDLGIRTLLDAPCGDFNWMRHVDLADREYIGVDVVEELIADNHVSYGHARRRFVCLDLIADRPPSADLVLCRDCLVHLSFREAKRVLRNFNASGARYLLTTTFTATTTNTDLREGFVWRPLNLERPPFDFPEPLALIDEQCTEGDGGWRDKHLGLWRFRNLPI